MKVCGCCTQYAKCAEHYRTAHGSSLAPNSAVAEICMSFEDTTKIVKTVVYCKDCTYYSVDNALLGNVCTRLFTSFPMQAYDFCSYGKHKEKGG